MTSAEDVLRAHVLATVGETPESWPGGWPDEIEAALLDAVFSVRARYGNRRRGTGVIGAVDRWRSHRDGKADDLEVLARASEEELVAIANGGKIARRTKAQVVIDAAEALVSVGVVHAGDFADYQEAAREAYLSVRGCGPVTWAYLRMLLGQEDVKPDTWIIRFVQDVLPQVTTSSEAACLVHAVADQLNVSSRDLDHAIWRYRRVQA
jgi:hypothetical protein